MSTLKGLNMFIPDAVFQCIVDAAQFRKQCDGYTNEEVKAFLHGLRLMGTCCDVDEKQLARLDAFKRKEQR